MGQPMSRKFIENDKLFPSMLSHMIAVGEDTGDITSMLMRTADYYDLEVETATETMMSLMQPMIIVFLTGIVGVVLAAVLAPMVSMYTQLGDSL
jgi:type IV pilus assembly protein PilC